MTVNETFFFRDRMPFEGFRNAILPELLSGAGAERDSPAVVRRLLDRAGALFARDDSRRGGAPADGLERGHRRERHRRLAC